MNVLLYPEGIFKLNQSGAEIFLRCDGSRDILVLVTDLEQTFNTSGLGNDVRAFIFRRTSKRMARVAS